MLELAQQRNKVDVTRTSGFGQTVDAALLTSYHPLNDSNLFNKRFANCCYI
jgi:hypothetical protein